MLVLPTPHPAFPASVGDVAGLALASDGVTWSQPVAAWALGCAAGDIGGI